MREIDRGSEIPERYERIHLLGGSTTPLSVDLSELRKKYPSKRPLITTDFVLTGERPNPLRISSGLLVGLRYFPDVINIDHHAELPEMRRQISSTNLAIEYVNEFQPDLTSPKEPFVFITHTDADSLLAAGVLAGYLLPDERFGEAAIAADHTGAENPIADLLMALDIERDVSYSYGCLKAMLEGKPLLGEAQRSIARRKLQRELAKDLVNHREINDIGNGIYYAQLREKIPGEFLPALLPEASVIVLASPMEDGPNWEIKTRAGIRFPEGRSLQELRLPGWGGRWNAGGTGRNGGTENPEAFMDYLCDTYATFF